MRAALAKVWAVIIMPPIMFLIAMFVAVGAIIHVNLSRDAKWAAWQEKNPITIFSRNDTYTGYVMQEFPDKYVLTDTEGVVYKIDRPAIVKIQKAPDASR